MVTHMVSMNVYDSHLDAGFGFPGPKELYIRPNQTLVYYEPFIEKTTIINNGKACKLLLGKNS